MLENHTMESGMQDKVIVLQVAWRERGEIFLLFPDNSI
jgi:hypothetical protein